MSGSVCALLATSSVRMRYACHSSRCVTEGVTVWPALMRPSAQVRLPAPTTLWATTLKLAKMAVPLGPSIRVGLVIPLPRWPPSWDHPSW